MRKANRDAVLAGGRHDCMVNVALHAYGETVGRLRELGIELTPNQMDDLEDVFHYLRELLLSMKG